MLKIDIFLLWLALKFGWWIGSTTANPSAKFESDTSILKPNSLFFMRLKILW